MSREIVKKVVIAAGGMSAQFVVSSALNNVTPVNSKAQLVMRFIGVAVIAGMVGKKASPFIGEAFDEAAAIYDQAFPTQETEVE